MGRAVIELPELCAEIEFGAFQIKILASDANNFGDIHEELYFLNNWY